MKLSRLLCIVFLLVLSACTDGPSDEEFGAKLDGVLANPETYELDIISCVNDGEFIESSWAITNLADENRTFAFDVFLTNSDGEEEAKGRELVGESVAPGQSMEWETFHGGGERFDVGDVECRFEVYDSVLGAFRDEE